MPVPRTADMIRERAALIGTGRRFEVRRFTTGPLAGRRLSSVREKMTVSELVGPSDLRKRPVVQRKPNDPTLIGE